MLAAWKNFGPDIIHLTCIPEWEDDYVTTRYLANTAAEAGLTVKLIPMEEIGWNGQEFIDKDKLEIKKLFKLYPWEWLINEGYRSNAHQASVQIIEPIWKMILSNKALMVLLWEMFPGHPNLLPAYFDKKYLSGDYVKKPLLGRLGHNVSLYSTDGNIITDGIYGDGQFMYQQSHLLPKFDGNYALVGSWVIAGEAAGINVREDTQPISNDDSRFAPHYY